MFYIKAEEKWVKVKLHLNVLSLKALNINEKVYRKLFRPLSFDKHFITADKIHFR